jgi:hypothetical protein
MKTCPKVCSDIPLNLKNRDWAFKNVGYGPANPDSPEDFWKIRAEEWNTSEKNAQTMHCGNCSAFIQTPEMMDCIIKGIQGEESDNETYANEVVASAELGWAIDERKLYIGNGTLEEGAPVIGNTEVLTQFSDILSYATEYTYKGDAGGYTVQTGATTGSPVSQPLQYRLDSYAVITDFINEFSFTCFTSHRLQKFIIARCYSTFSLD